MVSERDLAKLRVAAVEAAKSGDIELAKNITTLGQAMEADQAQRDAAREADDS